MDQLRSSLFAGVAFGLLFGGVMVGVYGWDPGGYIGLLSGVFFGLGTYIFLRSGTVRKQTEIDLGGESVLYSGGANHFLRGEGVGGRLYLLETRLVFKSHHFNVQNHIWDIPLIQIQGVRGYSPLGLIPNGLEIIINEGNRERFVVHSRRKWIEAINKALNASGS